MTPLVWSPAFTRALKQKIRRNPELREQVERTLRQLTEDPFHPSLHSHKLKGTLAELGLAVWLMTCGLFLSSRKIPNLARKRFCC